MSYLTLNVNVMLMIVPRYSRILVPSLSSGPLPPQTQYIIYQTKTSTSINYIYFKSAYFSTLTVILWIMISCLATLKLNPHHQTTSSADVLSSPNRIPACCVAPPSFWLRPLHIMHSILYKLHLLRTIKKIYHVFALFQTSFGFLFNLLLLITFMSINIQNSDCVKFVRKFISKSLSQ